MGANNSNGNSSGKQSSQALRDKLNQSLKQRLSRRAGETAAAQEAAAVQDIESIEPSIEALQELPNAALKSGQADRSKQFLDDIESEAQKEVEKMDHMPLFHPKEPESPTLATRPAPSSHERPGQTPATPRQASSHDETSDAEGPPDMNHEDEAKTEPSSLLNLIKNSKGEAKSGSFLKAPRQSAQSAQGSGSRMEEDSIPAGPRKDTFLKAPRLSRQAHDEQSATTEPASAAPTHEQEIIDAIRRGDAEWLRGNARLEGIAEGRQEIILIFSLAQPKCIEALFELGLKFNPDPKTGLALRAAIAKKHYAALDIMKSRKARLELDTMKAVAAWKRSQQTRSTGAHEPVEADSMDGDVAKKLQDDFDQFLIEHAKEIGEDDLSAFSKPQPEPEPEHVLPTELDSATKAVEEDEAPDEDAPPPMDTETLINDFDSLALDPIEGSEEPAAAAVESSGDPDQIEHAAPALDPLPDSGEERTHSARHGHEAGRANRNPDTEQDMPSPTTPANERKTGTASPGSTAMERARQGMLEKVMAEKQQLEMRVIELQMYQEAAESLEQERDKLMEDLDDAQAANDQLAGELAEVKAQYANFDKIKANFEAQITKAKADAARSSELFDQERKELLHAQSVAAAAQSEAERREAELRALNAQLSGKIDELANRKAPTPEAPDWLAGTDKETALRKEMFVDSVIKGESKLLDNIAKNTSVDHEMAHLSLIFAAQHNQLKCAQWLVDNMDVHPGYGGELATRRAVEAGNHEMVRWLASRGADIHHAEEFALRLAADRDDVEMLDLLVELGANPRAARERALVEAASEASWKAFRALLGHGCTGLDEHGQPLPELAEHEEAQELIVWVAHQRKLAKALDPEFAKRQGRR